MRDKVVHFRGFSSSGARFNDSNYNYSNANAGHTARNCFTIKKWRPCHLAKDNKTNLKGAGTITGTLRIESKGKKQRRDETDQELVRQNMQP